MTTFLMILWLLGAFAAGGVLFAVLIFWLTSDPPAFGQDRD